MPVYGNFLSLKIWVRKDWRTSEWLVSPRQYGFPLTIRVDSFEEAISKADEVVQALRWMRLRTTASAA